MDESEDRIAIRDARVDDAEALAPLITELGYPSTPEQMRARLARFDGDPDRATYVAERDGRIVGSVGVVRGWGYTDDEPYARILSLVVDPAERGRGTGAALVRAAEEWARAHGASSIHLTANVRRQASHVFYRRVGYRDTGLRFVKMLE